MSRLLVVDDEEINSGILKSMLEGEYEVDVASNGMDAVRMIKEAISKANNYSLILLDLYMPGMDGFGVIEELKLEGIDKSTPILVVSGETSVDVQNRCFELGVMDFIPKAIPRIILHHRVKNTIELFEYKNKLEHQVDAQTKQINNQYELLKTQAKQLKENNERIIDILGTIVESRNLESGAHIKRVKGFSMILADEVMRSYPEYGLDEYKVYMITSASSLHDIGKISISDDILTKPGRLTREEFEIMKTHTTAGCELLEKIEGAWNEDFKKISYDICRHHHEKFDGKGYPDGLRGDEIPIAAQIVSVADVYDALVCERCYKDAFTNEQAFQMIVAGECGMFNPKLMVCFRKCIDDFHAFAQANKNMENKEEK